MQNLLFEFYENKKVKSLIEFKDSACQRKSVEYE